jgi:hypothetical protein
MAMTAVNDLAAPYIGGANYKLLLAAAGPRSRLVSDVSTRFANLHRADRDAASAVVAEDPEGARQWAEHREFLAVGLVFFP